MTLSAAIMVSLVVSLTTTPMMCAMLLKPEKSYAHHWLYRTSERAFNWIRSRYDVTLRWALRHSRFMLCVTLATVMVNICLFFVVPKGFFPETDTGRIRGTIQAEQDISFQAMKTKLETVVNIIKEDPDVEYVAGFTGGGRGGSAANTASMFITLKPFEQRKTRLSELMSRLRKKLAGLPGAPTYLQPVQDLRIGEEGQCPLSVYPSSGRNLGTLYMGSAHCPENADIT